MHPDGMRLSIPELLETLLFKLRDGERMRKYCIDDLSSLQNRLQVAVALVKGIMNSLQFICKLPNELLSRIFIDSQEYLASYLPLVTTEYLNSPPIWRIIPAVCRRFREIAMSTPELWTTIDSARYSDSIHRYLTRRPSSLPLTIYLGGSSPSNMNEFMDNLSSRCHCIKQFHLFEEFPWGPIYPKLASPAPLLESLTLEGGRYTDFISVFDNNMPNLRKLCLRHYSFWEPGLFSNLTHLCLHAQNTHPTTTAFIEFLQSSPLLEELALVDAGPRQPSPFDTLPPTGKVVDLPRMKNLGIGEWGQGSFVARLLTYISLPADANLFIWGTPLLSASEDFASFLPYNDRNLKNLHSVTSFHLLNVRYPSLQARMTFVCIMGSTRSIYISGKMHSRQLIPALDRLHPENFESVCVQDSTPTRRDRLPNTIWLDIFRRMPNMKSLRVLAFQSLYGVTRQILSCHIDDLTLCPLLNSLIIEHDAALSMSLIRRLAIARRIESLKVLVYDPVVVSTSEPDWGYSEEADIEWREELNKMADDDLDVIRDFIGEVVFERGKPLSAVMSSEMWPRAYLWATRQTDEIRL